MEAVRVQEVDPKAEVDRGGRVVVLVHVLEATADREGLVAEVVREVEVDLVLEVQSPTDRGQEVEVTVMMK